MNPSKSIEFKAIVQLKFIQTNLGSSLTFCLSLTGSMAALAMRNQTTAPTTVGQLMATTPYIQTAGNPLVKIIICQLSFLQVV